MSKKKTVLKLPPEMRSARWIITLIAITLPLLPIVVWLQTTYPIYQAMGMGWFTLIYLPARALGLVGFVLMVYQFVMSTRFAVIEKAFTRPLIFKLHKNLGLTGFLLMLMHGLFMLVFDIVMSGTVQLDAARLAGIVSLLILIISVGAALWWKPLKLSRKTWMAIHRLIYLVLPLALYHAIALGTSLQSSRWLMGLFYALGGIYLVTLVRRTQQAVQDFRKKQRPRQAAVDQG
ncbi:ferric reductase-like transmembrane domain-containing protein [Spirochaeta dissipatitropha]